MATTTYRTPVAFRQALEQRLRSTSQSGADFTRRRQVLIFNRFLARVAAVLGDAVIVKGGVVLVLRLPRARTTKDVDLRLVGAPDDVLVDLQRAARFDLRDFLAFTVRPDDEQPAIQNDGMRYEGLRFHAACTMAGKLYGEPFGVDVAFGDPMVGEPDRVVTEDTLAFAGIEPPTLLLYPVVTHIAEKLHAYTMPRRRPNTRVKDLPDLALLAGAQSFASAPLRLALTQTFGHRQTHDLPLLFPDPPPVWAAAYAVLARANQLPWPDLPAVTTAVRAFLDPVLASDSTLVWDPTAWMWS